MRAYHSPLAPILLILFCSSTAFFVAGQFNATKQCMDKLFRKECGVLQKVAGKVKNAIHLRAGHGHMDNGMLAIAKALDEFAVSGISVPEAQNILFAMSITSFRQMLALSHFTEYTVKPLGLEELIHIYLRDQGDTLTYRNKLEPVLDAIQQAFDSLYSPAKGQKSGKVAQRKKEAMFMVKRVFFMEMGLWLISIIQQEQQQQSQLEEQEEENALKKEESALNLLEQHTREFDAYLKYGSLKKMAKEASAAAVVVVAPHNGQQGGVVEEAAKADGGEEAPQLVNTAVE